MNYDIIIIGAGSAGAILAARLSEDATRSVLLLEAGPDYPDLATLPDDIKYGFGTPAGIIALSHDWGYCAQATEKAATIPVPRGKIVGGSSAVNAQIFLRAIPDDFAQWVALGNDQWGFDQVLPYFRKLENDLDFDDEFHSTTGPIKIKRNPPETWRPDQVAFYDACRAAGFPDCPDHNRPNTTGVGPFPLNNVDGVRYSTALGYLSQARERTNLTIRPNCPVQRICFDGLQATGVEIDQNGNIERIEAAETIVCSGAIGSPQLLMVSGVGPGTHLSRFDIPIVADLLGVGQNLRDHPTVPLNWKFSPNVFIDEQTHWHQVGLRYTATNSEYPNDMIIYIGANPIDRTLFIRPTINLAMGSGEIRLQASDPSIHPIIDYQYYTHPFDQQRQRETLRLTLDLTQHDTFQKLLGERLIPHDDDLDSDERLTAYIMREATTGHHPACTCKMGPASDPQAVVDQTGRVHGLRGLRVVDAAILPTCVRANINATVMMMAEKIADTIRQESDNNQNK